MPWTPHDYPFIVEKARTKQVEVIDHLKREGLYDNFRNNIMPLFDMLDTSNLLWIDTGMCDMVEDTYTSIPEWSPRSCMPGESGVIGFEKPFFTCPIPSATDGEFIHVPTHAISWSVNGDQIIFSAWTVSDMLQKSAIKPAAVFGGMENTLSFIKGLDELISESDTFEKNPNIPLADYQASSDAARMVRNTIGAVWLLMSQPRVVEESDPVEVRVRTKRNGKTVKSPVRVSVRSLVGSVAPRGQSTGRKATSRWWVRGHWRQQAWGQGRKLRKPVWIAPHTAGAEGAPVDDRPSVQVWRTGGK